MSIIPTISSGTAGPLGVQHLPRLWQKASLDAAGKLHSDYPAAGAGFDQMTLDALGIERQAFLDYVSAEKPNYVACEAWCQANGNFDADKVAAHNAAVNGYNHDDDTRNGILSAVGLAADAPALLRANGLEPVEAAYVLSSVVPNIISVEWNSSASHHVLTATLVDLTEQMRCAKAVTSGIGTTTIHCTCPPLSQSGEGIL